MSKSRPASKAFLKALAKAREADHAASRPKEKPPARKAPTLAALRKLAVEAYGKGAVCDCVKLESGYAACASDYGANSWTQQVDRTRTLALLKLEGALRGIAGVKS